MNTLFYKIAGRLLALILLVSLTASAAIISPEPKIKLEWDYPIDQLSPDLRFNIYHTTDISVPVSQWKVLISVVGTNLSVMLPKLEGPQFFAITASSASGESAFAGRSL